ERARSRSAAQQPADGACGEDGDIAELDEGLDDEVAQSRDGARARRPGLIGRRHGASPHEDAHPWARPTPTPFLLHRPVCPPAARLARTPRRRGAGAIAPIGTIAQLWGCMKEPRTK